MANYERGMYEPSDEVRVFDGTEEDEDVEGSRLPLLIVLALLVLAMFAGVVWLAYTQGVARGRGETPVLAAAPGPEKIAPQSPGGASVPYQGFKIYEQPAPADDEADASNPPAAAAAPVAPAPLAAAPVAAPVVAAPPPVAIQKPPTPVIAPAPKPTPVLAPKPVLAQRPPLPPPPPMKKTISSTPIAPPVAPVPQVAPMTATGAPRTLPGLAAKSVPAAPASAPASVPVTAKSGGYVLQIGAYKSEGDAQTAWSAYKAKHAALLSGYGPDVQRADLGDKGTWYRLRIAGFSDRDVASALCDRLKADSGGCFLGK